MSPSFAAATLNSQLRCSQEQASPVVECSLTPEVLLAHGPACTTGRTVVFADRDVWQSFAPWLGTVFANAYPDVQMVPLVGGEACKRWDMLQNVLEQMAALQILRRGDALYALGGGSVLDLVGFAASIYRRGVPLTKLPTTLIGQVDAAIGLKNAINMGGAKNLVGSFAPPYSVLLDFSLLDTLPARHWSNGIAEIIKLGLVTDAALIHELTGAGTQPAAPEGSTLRRALRRAIAGMVAQLSANPYEKSLQRAVDFGHWLSPQLEMADCALLHGEAVAIDMAVSLTVALQRGLLARDDWSGATRLLSSWRLPLTHRAVNETSIQDSLERTARHRGGVQNIPLCVGLGRHEFVDDLRALEVLQAHRLLLSDVPDRAVEVSYA